MVKYKKKESGSGGYLFKKKVTSRTYKIGTINKKERNRQLAAVRKESEERNVRLLWKEGLKVGYLHRDRYIPSSWLLDDIDRVLTTGGVYPSIQCGAHLESQEDAIVSVYMFLSMAGSRSLDYDIGFN